MRYLPKSQSERREMLDAIGAKSIEKLFETIPAKYRLNKPLDLPGPLSEMEIIDYFKARATENSRGYTSFLGAGVYQHVKSVVTDALVQRGEFLTSYTPYQAEISQGTLQAIFEFQTLMAQLTGQEVANASMYDGSTALTEAVLMAERLTRRHRVLVANTVHPEYRQVLATYAKHLGIQIEEFGFTASGRADVDALRDASLNEAAAVVVQSPNFFGVLEKLALFAERAHAAGALLIDCITEPVSLGIVKPPEEADIVALEAQSFGVPASYGGPFVGVIAAREKFVRQMPGRLAGEALDAEGRRGFCLTLATREQHIRREKATSNICTNEALYALVVTIHLCLLGKEGLHELAAQNLSKARFAQEQMKTIPGVTLPFSGAAFNEFVLDFPRPVAQINQKLLSEKIIGPLALDKYYRGMSNRALVCVTETMPRAEIERFAAALRKVLAN
ncbi:MAG TPA: aminomethyl-transferring glycine dehydrogenase subunit GcvPA [Verrucomicrobiae bacterium]|nr:aminomethyl-transferring glycine dehydrogenase subunit GcvPA [Verrucomicrobiae bacterium]